MRKETDVQQPFINFPVGIMRKVISTDDRFQRGKWNRNDNIGTLLQSES